MSLDKALSVFRRWLVLPDTSSIEVVLAAYVAHRLPGDPVWLMLVGPPSSGKSEALRALFGLPDIYSWSDTTTAGLLTRPQQGGRRGGGGLLNEMTKRSGGNGVIVASDFGAIFNQSAESVRATTDMLRDVFDGQLVRRTGAAGGDVQTFNGKVAFLAAVTEVVDEHARVMADLGHRFVFFRMPELSEVGRIDQAMRSIDNAGSEEQMRAELHEVVRDALVGVDVTISVDLPEAERRRIAQLADFATRCRSGVVRSGRDRQVEVVPQAEGPGRVPKQLAQLRRAMNLLGMQDSRSFELLTKIAHDCVPKDRRRIAELLARRGPEWPLATQDIAAAIRYPEAATRRALEDLVAHGVVHREGLPGRELWSPSLWLTDRAQAWENGG